MTSSALDWRYITHKKDARDLQQFCCTVDWRRSPEGRALKPHPKPWEWEVQRHLRQSSTNLKAGDLLVAGYDDVEVVAAARLAFAHRPEWVETFVECAAVHVKVRGRGGDVADQLMNVVREVAIVKARDHGVERVRLVGNIHHANIPSQSMARRAGLGFTIAPTGEQGQYSLWAVEFRLA